MSVRPDAAERLAGRKSIVRMLTPAELSDMRARENREGSPYSDRDMLLDHVEALAAELSRVAERERALADLAEKARATFLMIEAEALADCEGRRIARWCQDACDVLLAAGVPAAAAEPADARAR